MGVDPLKEVLQKVVVERRSQLDDLDAQLKSASDPVQKAAIEQQVLQLQAELRAAEQALGQTTQSRSHIAEPAATLQPQVTADPQLLASDVPVVAPKSPSKAALEAQIRELQTQLLDAAHAVEKGGAKPNAMDVAHLNEVREKLQRAMKLVGSIDLVEDPGELPPRPTPSQLSEADNLIKRSLLEKRRGNTKLAGDLLRQAADVAPGSPTVLEALGDDIMERGQPKAAAEIYAKAKRIQPNNVSIERKYAIAVGRSKGAVTIEEALQASLGDGPLSAADAANVKIAAILSFFIPGGGQIILGEYVKGGAFLGVWIILMIWISVADEQWKALLASIAGTSANFNPTILVPVLGIVGLGIAAAFTCKKGDSMKMTKKKSKVDRPAPPVDLPFE